MAQRWGDAHCISPVPRHPPITHRSGWPAGTVAFVHEHCLRRWQNAQLHLGRADAASRCDICRGPYNCGDARPRPPLASLPPASCLLPTCLLYPVPCALARARARTRVRQFARAKIHTIVSPQGCLGSRCTRASCSRACSCDCAAWPARWASGESRLPSQHRRSALIDAGPVPGNASSASNGLVRAVKMQELTDLVRDFKPGCGFEPGLTESIRSSMNWHCSARSLRFTSRRQCAWRCACAQQARGAAVPAGGHGRARHAARAGRTRVAGIRRARAWPRPLHTGRDPLHGDGGTVRLPGTSTRHLWTFPSILAVAASLDRALSSTNELFSCRVVWHKRSTAGNAVAQQYGALALAACCVARPLGLPGRPATGVS